jgi:hypothetical protein
MQRREAEMASLQIPADSLYVNYQDGSTVIVPP